MRALILYSSSGRLDSLVTGLKQGLASVDIDVQLQEANRSQSQPIAVSQYDLIFVGSPIVGALGGKISEDVENMLKQVNRMEGKKCIAFVKPSLFGTTKGLRALMSAMEKQGAIVVDFASVSSPREAQQLGKRAKKLIS
jgi:menaquinone-dependent protoporphyrinogen IX oxidase